MVRSCIGALMTSILVAACGASGATPSASPIAATTEDASGGSSTPAQAVPAESCAPRPGYSNVPDGTRVDDQVNGLAITLPTGWAQIDLASGNVAPAFSALTLDPGTAALVKAIGPKAKGDGYEWLAVDLAPNAGSSQSAAPADLLIDLSPANGATLDTIAAGLTTDLRTNGVTGDIEQLQLKMAGRNARGLRFSEITQDLNGQQIQAVETYYIALRGDTQFTLVFSVAAENASGSAAIFNALAQSLEFPSSVASGCSAATPSDTSASTTTSGAPGGFRVVEIDVRADPNDYTGACPVKVAFAGRITVAGGSGAVSYKWTSSDNTSSPVQTLTFTGPGSQDVSSDWTVSGATLPNRNGWTSIEILDPTSTESDSASSTRVSFTINCQ